MAPSLRRSDEKSAPFTPFLDVDDTKLGRLRATAGASGISYDNGKLVHAYNSAEETSSRASSRDQTVRAVQVTEYNLRAHLAMLDPDDSAVSTIFTKANKVLETSNINQIDVSGGDISFTNLGAKKVVLHRHSDSIDTEALFRPIVETRYVRGGHNGPAPFTKPHIITETCEAAFTGPHAAIEITIGLDRNSWIHIPQKLTAAELHMATTAIFDLWLGIYRYQDSHASEDSRARDVPQSKEHYVGPPDAPYPMTRRVHPAPFKGPHTYIRNTGRRLKGWILHVPRFLTKEQIHIATTNLRHAANDPDAWTGRFDSDTKLAVTRSAEENAELTSLLKQQVRTMTFLKDVIGLDFAAQDDKNTDLVPLWTEHAVVHQVPATPVHVTLPLTPPPTIPDKLSPARECYEQQPAASESYLAGFQPPTAEIKMDEIEHPMLLSRSPPSSSGSEWTDVDIDPDREEVSTAGSLWKKVVSSSPVEEAEPAKPVSSAQGETTTADASRRNNPRPSPQITPRRGLRKPLVILPRDTLISSLTKRANEPIFNDVLDDLASEDDLDSLLSQISVQASPISLRSLESRVDHLTNQVEKLIREKMQEPASSINTTQTDTFCPCNCMNKCTGARFAPAAEFSLPSWLRLHIRVGLPGTIVAWCLSSWFCDMQKYMVYPTDVVNFLSAQLVQRNGITALTGMMLLVSISALAWYFKDWGRAWSLYKVLVPLGWIYFGAVQAMDQELWDEILNPRLLH